MNRNKNEIINKIEDILLNGKKFDKARRKILLDNRNSFQVQACPGSGKTTLLVAKLMFLAQVLDFSKDSVCVLTHTNVAVDEIKRKIKKHNKPGYEDFINNVYKLFDYPNYIGTIQGFLDKYLGIPGYEKKYRFKPNIIDDDRVKSSIEKGLNNIYYLKNRFNLKENIKNGNFNIFESKFDFGGLPGKSTPTYNQICNIKLKQIEEYKYLNFKEIDYFSKKYLDESENIQNLLQKRFKYVYLDEIQDTHSLHIEILNKLYNGNSNNVIQGFGDYNQEIFNSDSEEKGVFTIFGSDEPRQINNSMRLSSFIAENVKNICIKPQELKGISGKNIPIYFIIFDNPEEVIQKYLEVIKKHEDDFIGIEKEDRIFKAIGWVQDKKENGKHGILNYWEKYNNGKIIKNKSNLFSYFQKIDEKDFRNKGYSIYKDNIVAGILHAFNQNKDNQILNKYEDKDGNLKEKHFSKTTFIDYLKINYLYNEFQEKVFKFSNDIQKLILNWDEVRTYILNLEINGKEVKDDNFLKSEVFGTPDEISNLSKDNLYTENEYKVKISTIAKIKGETHTGTLVLDTDFHEQNTSKILEFWNNSNNKDSDGVRSQKGLKNHYVALTRSTHLLCISVYKGNYNAKYDYIFEGENILKI